MNRKIIGLAAAAFGLLVLPSAPAAAQYSSAPQPPPQQPSPPASAPAAGDQPTPPGEVLRAAVCAVGRDANPATALLATVPRSSEERSQAVALLRAAQRCLRLPDPIATSATYARGAFAEALYEAQFATPVAARSPAAGAAPLPRPANAADQMSVALAPMYGLADCSTPRHPDLVRAVLATEPRTPEETAALAALHPDFQACVPPGTTQLSYDPRFTRGFLAEALYRWSVVQRDGPTSPMAAPAAAGAPAPSGP